MVRWRRLVRDYDKRIDLSQAMIVVAMGGNLLRRNARPGFFKWTLTGPGHQAGLELGCSVGSAIRLFAYRAMPL